MRGFVASLTAAACVVASASGFDFSSQLSHRVVFSSSAKAQLAASVDGSTVLGDYCNSTNDCPSGTSCIAGSALEAIQSCVQEPVCTGTAPGNCPGLVSSGQLVCAWSPTNASACSDKNGSCTAFNGVLGIYKCMSVDRCDAIAGPASSSCSSGCKTSNGLTCNGRGSCQTADGAAYKCACNTGWSGVNCEVVVDGSCQAGVGSCGAHGKCANGTCQCDEGYSGAQCEVGTTTTQAPLVTSADPSDQGIGPIPSPSTGLSSSTIIAIVVIILALLAIGIVAFLIVKKKKREREAAELRALINQDDDNDREHVTTPKAAIQVL